MPIEPPVLFIGSSSEALSVAQFFQHKLAADAQVVLWTQGVFALSRDNLNNLLRQLSKTDFALLIMSPDDKISSRGESAAVPRDNLLLELGLAIGRLGRERCFWATEVSVRTKLPSDLLGLTAARYRWDSATQTAEESFTSEISSKVKELGPRRKFAPADLDDFSQKFSATDLTGQWDGFRPDSDDPASVGSVLTLQTYGEVVHGHLRRLDDDREFIYEGRLIGRQLLLHFREQSADFIVGTMVLLVSSNSQELRGDAVFFHHDENRIKCNSRLFRRQRSA